MAGPDVVSDPPVVAQHKKDWADAPHSWEAYARVLPHTREYYESEPVQRDRVDVMIDRARGKVLDVGGGDGFLAYELNHRGHEVEVVDISETRVARCHRRSLAAQVGDACDLPHPDQSVDTVLLGEVLEHLANPGEALAEACRVARDRVVISLPLDGWADPTHQWRVSLDVLEDPVQHASDPTKGRQIVLTLVRGTCWPADYWMTDPTWEDQFSPGF